MLFSKDEQDAAEARRLDADDLAASRYAGVIESLLCDGVFCEEDQRALESFRAHLGVSPERAEIVFQDVARTYVRRRILQFLDDGRLSPNEDAVLEDLVVSIGLGPPWAEEIEAALSRARRTWALASEPLPAIQTDLGLIAGETAYARVDVSAFEEREKTVGVTYGGLTVSIPIVRGLRYRAGQYGLDRKTIRYQQPLGSGDLTVTSRRLIFRSPERAITCNLTSIIDITAYADGVAIQRTVGKPTTYVQETPDEDFGLILWRAWQEARGIELQIEDQV